MPRYRSLALAVLAMAAMSDLVLAAPLTPYQRAMVQNFTHPAAQRYAQGKCGSGERECQIDAIYWCCRRDQQCGYRYAGECR